MLTEPSSALLATKLYIPQQSSNGRRHPSLIPCPRLVEKLNAGLESSVTLVSASACFDKSTLVTEWIHAAQAAMPDSRFCWLSLDETNNDPH